MAKSNTKPAAIEEDLKLVNASVEEVLGLFNKYMIDGSQFTLKVEIHGNNHELIHCRVVPDNIRRPQDTGVKSSN